MAKTIDAIKDKILEQVLSQDELENIMAEYRYHLIETEDSTDMIKFTNYSSQIWMGVYREENNGNILITNVSRVNKIESEPTRVEPFRTYEDLENVLNYFKTNGYYNHWITGWFMTSLGRRVGDTVALKWADIFRADGKYRKRLTQLEEEKTGKKLAPILNALAKQKIEEYIELTGIKPMQHYDETIVDNSSAAFRKMLKKAVDNVGLEYSISTHSFRKWYANTIYRLHPQDADSLMIVQTMLGHSSPEITKIYIGEIDKKQDKYNEDYSNYMIAKDNGTYVDISNSPIVALKSDCFRDLLGECFDLAINGEDKFESINKIIGMAEQMMI